MSAPNASVCRTFANLVPVPRLGYSSSTAFGTSHAELQAALRNTASMPAGHRVLMMYDADSGMKETLGDWVLLPDADAECADDPARTGGTCIPIGSLCPIAIGEIVILLTAPLHPY